MSNWFPFLWYLPLVSLGKSNIRKQFHYLYPVQYWDWIFKSTCWLRAGVFLKSFGCRILELDFLLKKLCTSFWTKEICFHKFVKAYKTSFILSEQFVGYKVVPSHLWIKGLNKHFGDIPVSVISFWWPCESQTQNSLFPLRKNLSCWFSDGWVVIEESHGKKDIEGMVAAESLS